MQTDTRSERTPEEIADEHGEMLEFGRAVAKLRSAADELERNGHLTLSAYERTESVLGDMDVVFEEYAELDEIYREEEKKHRRGEPHDEEFCRTCKLEAEAEV